MLLISTEKYTLALSGEFFYVTYTTKFPLGGPDYAVIRTAPPRYSPVERMTTVHNSDILILYLRNY